MLHTDLLRIALGDDIHLRKKLLCHKNIRIMRDETENHAQAEGCSKVIKREKRYAGGKVEKIKSD